MNTFNVEGPNSNTNSRFRQNWLSNNNFTAPVLRWMQSEWWWNLFTNDSYRAGVWSSLRKHRWKSLITLVLILIFASMLISSRTESDHTDGSFNTPSRRAPHNEHSNWTHEHHRVRLLELHTRTTPAYSNGAVLLVTGSQSEPCEPKEGTERLLNFAKNKIDYCRMHNFSMFYNMADVEEHDSEWAKVAIIPVLMASHPEKEWIWWIDANAVFTNMTFRPEFAQYENHHLVLHRDDESPLGGDASSRQSRGVNLLNFFIRNCQWSIDFLDAWASMRPEPFDQKLGGGVDLGRPRSQHPPNALSALLQLLQSKPRLASKVCIEISVTFSGHGSHVNKPLTIPQPIVTHFNNDSCDRYCNPGNYLHIVHRPGTIEGHHCFHRTNLDYSFQYVNWQINVDLTSGFHRQPFSREPRIFVPEVRNWNLRRWNKLEKDPSFFLVTGIGSTPCSRDRSMGIHVLLEELKNKLDYCRLHNMNFFYYKDQSSEPDLERLEGPLVKIPLLKMLMRTHPSVKWFWWLDERAILTDMHSLWNPDVEGYDESKYLVVQSDSGPEEIESWTMQNFLIRNCEWSLRFLDTWGKRISGHSADPAGSVVLLSGSAMRWSVHMQNIPKLSQTRYKWRPPQGELREPGISSSK